MTSKNAKPGKNGPVSGPRIPNNSGKSAPKSLKPVQR